MRFTDRLKWLIECFGYTLNRISPDVYNQDGLQSLHNHDFMLNPDFSRAYERGVTASKQDYHWHWRVHIGLWAAFSASRLNGDFVECGVNRGFLSSAIMDYLNWDSLNKTFYLMDTFTGIDEHYLSETERNQKVLRRNIDHGYTKNLDEVRANFEQWQNIHIIEGPIPDTLNSVETNRIAYLHLDMNNAIPEVAAFNFFWDRLVPGAFILLDDYAYKGYEAQYAAMNQAAEAKGVKIASLPTGQGLVLKPAQGYCS